MRGAQPRGAQKQAVSRGPHLWPVSLRVAVSGWQMDSVHCWDWGGRRSDHRLSVRVGQSTSGSFNGGQQ